MAICCYVFILVFLSKIIISAEWKFHPIDSGEDACDSIGANGKRSAARYSLQWSAKYSLRTAAFSSTPSTKSFKFFVSGLLSFF